MKNEKHSLLTVPKGDSQPSDNQPKSKKHPVENEARDINSIGSMELQSIRGATVRALNRQLYDKKKSSKSYKIFHIIKRNPNYQPIEIRKIHWEPTNSSTETTAKTVCSLCFNTGLYALYYLLLWRELCLETLFLRNEMLVIFNCLSQ